MGPAAVDAHCHLHDPAFADALPALLQEARRARVAWVLSATDPSSWQATAELARREGMPYTLGLHPWWLRELSDDDVDHHLKALGDWSDLHGIGESGVDFLRDTDPHDRQRSLDLTMVHLDIAEARGLPLVLHCVRGWHGLHPLLKARPPEVPVMLHGFIGSADQARQAIDLGCVLSVGPTALRSPKTLDALRAVGSAHVLLESDGPTRRGEGPTIVLSIAEALGRLWGVDTHEVLERTRTTAARLFPALSSR